MLPKRKTFTFNEKLAMHRLVQSLPGGTHPVEAVRLAQQAIIPADRQQNVPNLSIASRLLEGWREVAEKKLPAPLLQMPSQAAASQNTDDEVWEKSDFLKFHGKLAAGLYMVRIA